MVTTLPYDLESVPEMSPMKAAVLSFLMLSAFAMGGIGLYSTKAAADRAGVDGYGVSALVR